RATLRPHRRIRRQLEISHYIWRCYRRVDRRQRRVACYQSVRSLSIHSAQPDSLLSCRSAGAGHHDEPKPRGGARPFTGGKRLQSQFESRAGDSAFTRENRSSVAPPIQPAIRDSADPDRVTGRNQPPKKIAAWFSELSNNKRDYVSLGGRGFILRSTDAG